MHNTLPVGRPQAYGYQFYAFPLSILATQPRAEDWVLSNYIQVAHDLRGQQCDVPFCFYLYDYATSPWLEVVRATRSWTSRGPQPIGDVIRHAVADGFYVYLLADEFHLPGREPYQRWHFPHDILVHGVDDEDATFTVLGFNHNFQFRSSTVPQADLVAAYHSLDEHAVPDTPVLFYRLLDEAEYDFDLAYVIGTIEEYLSGANTSEHFRMLRQPWDRAYGMDSYPYLERYVRAQLAREEPYDVRNLHVLWEHKRMMAARIDRAARDRAALEKLAEPARRIEAMALALRNGMIRDQLKGGDARYAARAVGLLHDIAKAERAMLTDFVSLAG